jgi:hypothetical protein
MKAWPSHRPLRKSYEKSLSVAVWVDHPLRHPLILRRRRGPEMLRLVVYVQKFMLGATVEVLTTQGPAVRYLAEVSDKTLYVCTVEELHVAKAEGWPPIPCGFNRRFVVRLLDCGTMGV